MNSLAGRVLRMLFPAPAVTIAAGSSVVVIGRPGSGKSTLIRWMVGQSNSVVVYDAKWDPEEEWSLINGFHVIEHVAELGRYARVALRCPMHWFTRSQWGTPDHPWGEALEYPLSRRNTIAVFDEALATWPGEGGHPGTHRLIQQGRSFGVTTMVGTQLANNIDTRLLRMAKHVFVLGPPLHRTDLECLTAACRLDSEPLATLKEHEIAWWHESATKWTIFRPIRRNRPNFLVKRFWDGLPTNKPKITAIFLLVAAAVVFFLQNRSLAVTLATLAVFGYFSARWTLSRRFKVEVRSDDFEGFVEPEQTLRPNFVAPKRAGGSRMR